MSDHCHICGHHGSTSADHVGLEWCADCWQRLYINGGTEEGE